MQLVVIGLAGLGIGLCAGQLIRSLRPYIWLICAVALLCCLIVVYGVYFGDTINFKLFLKMC